MMTFYGFINDGAVTNLAASGGSAKKEARAGPLTACDCSDGMPL
jgi:hypothetical protein